MEKQREEGLDVGGEANKSELEGAIESGNDDKKLLGYEDGVKEEAYAVYTLISDDDDDDDEKTKHPRPKARAHKADSDNGEEEEDSENADEDDTDDEMHDYDYVDDVYGYSFMSHIKEMPDVPLSDAFPASLLSYVREIHCQDRPPSTDTELVYILEDEEGLARYGSYPVWEMKMQKRKMKLERVSVSYTNLMKLQICLALLDRIERKSLGK